MYTTIKHSIPKTNQTKTSKSPNLITYFSFDSSLFTYPPSPLPFFTKTSWLAGWPPFDAFNANQKNNMHYFFLNIADVVWGGDRTDRRLTDSSTNRMTQTVSECYESRRESQRERDSRVPLGSSDVPRFELFPYGLVWPSFVIIIILSSLTLPSVSCVFFYCLFAFYSVSCYGFLLCSHLLFAGTAT